MNSYLCIHCNHETKSDEDTSVLECEGCDEGFAWRMRCACGHYRIGKACANAPQCPLLW